MCWQTHKFLQYCPKPSFELRATQALDIRVDFSVAVAPENSASVFCRQLQLQKGMRLRPCPTVALCNHAG